MNVVAQAVSVLKDLDQSQLSHATWYWNDDQTAILQVYLPPRNSHGGIFIEATLDLSGKYGIWSVSENGREVAGGKVRRIGNGWRGKSPQERAEHVIVYGADS